MDETRYARFISRGRDRAIYPGGDHFDLAPETHEGFSVVSTRTTVLVLGPAIRQFGTAFESDMLRSSPETGRSFLTLLDVACFLIFGACTLMTLQYSRPANVHGAEDLVEWLGWESQKLGGPAHADGVVARRDARRVNPPSVWCSRQICVALAERASVRRPPDSSERGARSMDHDCGLDTRQVWASNARVDGPPAHSRSGRLTECPIARPRLSARASVLSKKNARRVPVLYHSASTVSGPPHAG